MNSGRLPVSRSSVSTVFRQISNRTPCATRLSTRLRLGFSGLQQIDAGAERHDLDRDLVGIVEFHQVVGDADHEALLLRVVVGELQHDACARRTACPAAAPAGRGAATRQPAISSAAVSDARCVSSMSRHPCPAMPGLPSTPFSVTPVADAVRRSCRDADVLRTHPIPARRFCSLTEAQPATL